MVDKSWGGGATGAFRVRTNDGAEDRAARRAQDRAARSAERADLTARRIEERAAARLADGVAREQAQTERRERERLSASGDPHAAAASRHRNSGRKDVVKEQRDTRGYTTVVDARRIRELATRGASVAGLAGAFGITEDAIARILAGDQDTGTPPVTAITAPDM